MDAKTRAAAARVSRETLHGQLSMIDTELETAEFQADNTDGLDARIIGEHITHARKILKNVLGAVEVSG
jgi:hypothetical protein